MAKVVLAQVLHYLTEVAEGMDLRDAVVLVHTCDRRWVRAFAELLARAALRDERIGREEATSRILQVAVPKLRQRLSFAGRSSGRRDGRDIRSPPHALRGASTDARSPEQS